MRVKTELERDLYRKMRKAERKRWKTALKVYLLVHDYDDEHPIVRWLDVQYGDGYREIGLQVEFYSSRKNWGVRQEAAIEGLMKFMRERLGPNDKISIVVTCKEFVFNDPPEPEDD